MNSFRSQDVKVSIVVPISNMEGRLNQIKHWLPQASEIGFQTIFICNNCDDNTFSELTEFSNSLNLSRVLILESPSLGPGLGRNEGLKQATGEFVAFWDADDSGNVQVLNTLVNSADTKVDVFVCNYLVVDSEGKESARTFGDDPKERMFDLCMNPGVWRMVFKRELLSECSFGISSMGEDQVFLARVFTKRPLISFSDEYIYRYYTGISTQLTSKKENLFGIVTSLNEIAQVNREINSEFGEMYDLIQTRLLTTLFFRGSITLKKEAIKQGFKLVLTPGGGGFFLCRVASRTGLIFRVVKRVL
jgi:glycosyltransferase involved in cell wall biosynthesis